MQNYKYQYTRKFPGFQVCEIWYYCMQSLKKQLRTTMHCQARDGSIYIGRVVQISNNTKEIYMQSARGLRMGLFAIGGFALPFSFFPNSLPSANIMPVFLFTSTRGAVSLLGTAECVMSAFLTVRQCFISLNSVVTKPFPLANSLLWIKIIHRIAARVATDIASLALRLSSRMLWTTLTRWR